MVVHTCSATEEDRTFEPIQALILAIDAKDRYTKRPSEDAARYGSFLANRLGVDPELAGAIRIAALLHDLGKFGFPNSIRKPAGVSGQVGDQTRKNLSRATILKT